MKDLIVENVDYLTNAVALKLNAFDVSPQAPQVLLMMIRLSWSSLLPYLEDTIDSVFAALENYHGYPLLVELLFQVLSVVAEEATRTPQLAIVAAKDEFEAIDTWRPIDITSLAAVLREKAVRAARAQTFDDELVERHPKTPWKGIDTSDEHTEDEEISEDHGTDVRMTDTEPLPPAPRVYNLLLKINDLTQHFLPSSSSSLRSRLLILIKTTIPVIAQHENSFLPLINTLWPEIVSRLDDEEQFILATALEVIAMLCRYARDFMRSRVAQIWPRLKDIHQTTANEILRSTTAEKSRAIIAPADLRKALQQMQASPSTYRDTGARILWSSIATLLASIVQHTKPSSEMFDEALRMAEPMLQQPDIRLAFARANADAVWLCDVRIGAITKPADPVVPRGVSWQFAGLPT